MKILFRCQYLSKAQLEAMKNYKFHGVDTNPFNNNITIPLCYKALPYIPNWLAPNVLTVGTLVLSLLSYFILMYYDYDVYASAIEFDGDPTIPNWVWLFNAFALFGCLVFDALDGKHARRIGACSPAGELLDHGIDSFRLMAPMLTCVFSLFGRGFYGLSSFRLFAMLLALQSSTVLTLYQQYITKTMIYNWSHDIAQYYLLGFYLLTFYRGGSRWWQCPGFMFPSNGQVLETFMYLILCTVSVYQQLRNLLKQTKNPTRCFPLRPFVAPTVFALFSLLWAYDGHPNVLELDTRAFLWLVSIVYANLTFRLMINTMTDNECSMVNPMVITFAIVAILSTFSFFELYELAAMRVLTVLATLYHIRYVTCVILQINDEYGLSMFKVKVKEASK